MKKLDQRLDQGFEILISGMAGVAHIIGEPPPKPRKDDPKTDHPSSFEKSLRDNKREKD